MVTLPIVNTKLNVPCDVYVGRPSKWGNPFAEAPNCTRQQVIRKYAEWILTQPKLLDALWELRGKVLGCWCWPEDCHAEVLWWLANGTSIDARVSALRAWFKGGISVEPCWKQGWPP